MSDAFSKAAYKPSPWGIQFHNLRTSEAFGAGAAGPGKSLCLNTLIPTPIGFRYFKDIHVGDTVFNVHGKQVKVIAETEVWHGLDCYKLGIADETVISCGNHDWVCQDGRILNTKAIHNTPFLPQLSFAKPTETSPKKLLLDSYVYGMCLVRGQPSDRSRFTAWDAELYSALIDVGYTLDNVGYKIGKVRERCNLINELIPESGRRISHDYLNGSFNQRMALLEGIVDGAGGYSPEVDSNDYPFLTDVYILCASLGLGPRFAKPRLGSKNWILKVSSREYKCSRRASANFVTKAARTAHRIKSIRPTPSVPTKCIQVEGGGTFIITKSYIPTHNSMVLLADPFEQIRVEHLRCQQEGVPPNWDKNIANLIEKNPLNWGHSEGWILHLRRTLPRLTETINRSHRMFPLLDPDAKWNEKHHTWTFSSGIKYEFGHCKDRTDYNNYLGKQYTYLGWDELVEFNKEQYDFISSRLRTGDAVLRHFLKNRSMSNPRLSGNKGEDISIDDPAWVKRYFVDPWPDGKKILIRKVTRRDGTVENVTRIYLPATLYDNPDPVFVKQYELQLMGRPKHIRDCYLYGKWDTIIGSHFGEDWNPTIHICKPFKIPPDWPIFRAMDWGYATNGNVGYYAVHPEGTLYKFYEYTFKKKNATEVAEALKAFEEKNKLWDPNQGSKLYGPSDKQIKEERGSSFKTKYEEFVEVGIDWCNADQKSRATNCEVFTNRLRSHNNFTQLPGIVFFENCRNSITTIPSLETDPNDLEVPKKGGMDHFYDETTYATQYAKQTGLSAPNYKGNIDYNEDEEPDDMIDRGSFGYWGG